MSGWLNVQTQFSTKNQLDNALTYFNCSEMKIENFIEELENNPSSKEFIVEETTESFKKLDDIFNKKIPSFYQSLNNKESYESKIKNSKENFEKLKKKFEDALALGKKKEKN